DAAAIADKQGNSERANAARASAAELEGKLAWVTIDARAALGVATAKLTIDAIEQPRAGFADGKLTIPIDSGPHVVEVAAVDYHPYKHTIDIQDGEKQQLAVPALVEDPTRRLALAKRIAEERRIARTRKRVALGLGAGGVAALGTAGALALL